jgi:dolichol-phosphate mannosyltransferase
MLGYGVTLHYISLGLPGLPRREGALAMGWRELGRLVEEVENEVILEEGREPVIVGLDKYYISSAIAFYDPNKDGAHETAGWGLFGFRRSLMYDFWFPPETCRGRSLVLVSEKRARLESPVVAARVDVLHSIREILVRRDGAVVGRYYCRVAHGYRGGPVQ